MLQSIFEWIYNNAMAIFISSFISFLLSKKYYDKANRENILMTVVFPVIQILNHNKYSSEDYEKLCEIMSNYSIRYLNKNERNKLLRLINSYKDISRYEKEKADTDSIMLYYEDTLKKNGINPKPCVLTDFEGEVVADDYPPDYNILKCQIYDIVSSNEFYISLNEFPRLSNSCTDSIVNILDSYTNQFYTSEKISLFDDYGITEIIRQSPITKRWAEKFNAFKKSQQDFLNLAISKKISKILDYSKSK